MAYYRCSEVIKMRRTAMNSKQEDYDVEGPAGMTVYRLEQGKTKGTERTYRSLTRSMGVEESLGQGILKTSEMEHLNALNEIVWNIRDGKLKNAEELMEMVRNQIDVEVPRNKQYIAAKYAELQYQRQNISAEEYEARLKEALAYTIPSFSTSGLQGWPFHDEELVLLVALSNALKKQKKYKEQKELAEDIRRCLTKEYLNSEMKNRFYILATIILADALGSLGVYREAIQLDREAIELCKKWNEFRNIEVAYYDVFWNLQKIKEKETLTESEEMEAYQCLLQACYVSKSKGNTKPLYEKKLMEYYPNN